MLENNPFLVPGGASTVKGGGGGVIEDPRAVENIVFQTRGTSLDDFEAKLAEDLMQVFGEGATELAEVVDGLNGAGSADRHDAAWSEASLRAQFKTSGDALFARTEGVSTHG